MGLPDYFALAARQPRKAFWLSWLTVLYCIGITFIVEFAPTSDVAKSFFTVLACFPIIFSLWFVGVGFVWPLYNSIREDEKALDPFAYVFAWFGKAVSVSMIYLIFWVWHKDSFDLFPLGIGAFEAWGWTLSAAFNTAVGTATYGSGDQNNVFLALIVNFDVFCSSLSNILALALVVSLRRTALEKPVEPIYRGQMYSDDD